MNVINPSSNDQPTQSIRPFLLIWSGQAVSLLGSQLVQFAIIWWLTKTSNSATVLAFASLAGLLPQIIIGPFAGALVDRWNRRLIMIVVDAAIALVTLLLAVLFWLNLASIGSIYALLLLRAAGAAFHWPAMQASTTLMVPQKHLARVGGLNQTLSGVAGILIPPLGALAINSVAMPFILLIDVATALPAIISLLFTPIPQPARTVAVDSSGKKPSVIAELRQGLQFILGWKALLMLSFIGIMIHLLGRAAGSLSPLMVYQHFKGGALELGAWQSAAGIGLVAGGLVLSAWGGFKGKVVTQQIGLVLDGIAIVIISVNKPDTFYLALVFIFFSAFLEAIVVGLSGAVAQMLIPPEMQGRVFALLISLTQGLAPLGLLVAGPVSDAFGVRIWWLATGVVIFVMGVVGLLIPQVIRIEDQAAGSFVYS